MFFFINGNIFRHSKMEIETEDCVMKNRNKSRKMIKNDNSRDCR